MFVAVAFRRRGSHFRVEDRLLPCIITGQVRFASNGMPLFYSERFAPLFCRFDGKRVGYVQLDGNVGDWMITEATLAH